MESKSSSLIPVPTNHLKIIKSVVIPYFLAIYMAEGSDPWRPLTQKDFDTLGELCLQACGELLRHKISEDTEIFKLVSLYYCLPLHLYAAVDID